MLFENVLKHSPKGSTSKKVPGHKILGAAKHSTPATSETELLEAGSERAGMC